MNVPSFLIWHCAGCGAPAKGTKKPCECATNVGIRTGPNGGTETTWWDPPQHPLGSAWRINITTILRNLCASATRPVPTVEEIEAATQAVIEQIYPDAEEVGAGVTQRSLAIALMNVGLGVGSANHWANRILKQRAINERTPKAQRGTAFKPWNKP